MKTTIDLPDDLYRQVKAKAAIEGRAVREVTVELYKRWLVDEPGTDQRSSALAWLEEWVRLGAELTANAPPGPTVREILEADRSRLDRR